MNLVAQQRVGDRAMKFEPESRRAAGCRLRIRSWCLRVEGRIVRGHSVTHLQDGGVRPTPSFRVAGRVLCDPQDLGNWLLKKAPTSVAVQRFRKIESAL